MTESDDKLSLETTKEEQVEAAKKESSHTAGFEPETSAENSDDDNNTPPVRKTLQGIGLKLPDPSSLASISISKSDDADSNNNTQLPKPLRLPALRNKIATAEHNAVKKDKKNKKSKNKNKNKPPANPLRLEPISQVGYNDSFVGEQPFEDSPPPEEPPEEKLIELQVLPVDDVIEKVDDVLEKEEDEKEEKLIELQVLPVEDIVENEIEEKTQESDDDYEGEATQLGAGLFDFPEKNRLQENDAFDDEHTQISESLNFESDRKDTEPADNDLEGDRTEIASLEEVFADAHRGAPAVVAQSSAPPLDEDDFEGEKTELFDSPFENDPICPKLTVLTGPALGMEFFVNKMRNTVGRGTNNTIVVPDASMSRQHFEINQSLDESFVLRDLQAVNGTFLNGTRIIEADLFHGDRIEAGKTVIQFLIASNAPQVSRNRRIIPATVTTNAHLQAGGANATYSAVPISKAPAATRDPSRLATYVALGSALLCIPLLIILLYLTPSNKKPASASPTPQQNSGIPATSGAQTASQTYLAGVEAVKKREWSRAQALFMQTVELEPNFDGISAQLTRIKQEQAAAKLLEEAQLNIEQDQNEQALLKIQQISQNSVYFDDAQRLHRQLRQQEVFSIFDQARANFDQGELDQASTLLTELLEIVPTHGEGLELKSRIEEAHKEAQRREEAAARALLAAERPATSRTANTIDWASSAPSKKSNSKSTPKSTATASSKGAPVINFTQGFTFYRAKDFNNAVRHFESIASSGTSDAIGQRAERTVTNIRRFETSYNNGQAAFQKSNWAEAARHLQEASRADVAVGGAKGYFSQELSEKLARSFAEMGIEAFNARQYERAFTSLQRGSSHNSQEATLQRLSKNLSDHATTLYDQANKLKGSDSQKAAAHCRTILSMQPPSSAVYKNAKKLLDTL